jgi:heme exporter protein A
MDLTITADRLARTFNRRRIFADISFTLRSGTVLVITGRNGSGKSTLVKILTHLLSPSAGRVTYHADGREMEERTRLDAVGLVSPYLQLYDEFSARENLHLSMAMRGGSADDRWVTTLLDRVALGARGDDPVGTYSSGMKQRAKYALALVHRPPLLVLDEPMANLDAEGMEIVRALMQEQRSGGILVVATNDLTDVAHYDERVDLHGGR